MLATLLLVLVLDEPIVYPNAGLLIEADGLAKPNDARNLRILDARTKAQYRDGHIPGAVWVDSLAWSKAMVEAPDEGWPERLASVGIEPRLQVVVYADDIRDAARVWWMLRFAGVADARLLNGGWSVWTASKHPVEKQENTARAKATEWKIHRERLSTKDDVLNALKEKSAQILDARSEGEFCGETKSAKRLGSIPGAIHLEWTDLLDAKTKRFKSAPDLKKLLDDRKIDLGKPTVTYCQSGGRAAVVAFGLELMDGKRVRNYYRSWAEWGNNPDTPIEKGKR
jgi:thiosulfate/3-mercaptopyruvate sulfurtransferase